VRWQTLGKIAFGPYDQTLPFPCYGQPEKMAKNEIESASVWLATFHRWTSKARRFCESAARGGDES
jgi:hypothetical protein